MKQTEEEMNEREQARNYWDSNPPYGAGSAMWTGNPIIGEAVYKRMSGGQSARHWLSWLIEDYFQGKKFKNQLSPGCGTGAH